MDTTIRIAVVCSEFNASITQKLFDGCIARLMELGVSMHEPDAVWVPGAIELPIVAQHFAQLPVYDAVICLGAVIRGETSHYDSVCESVTYGCQRVSLDYNKPIIFGVLTTENSDQAQARVGGSHGHKGCDAADTAVRMVNLLHKESAAWKVVQSG